jgi:hypothetical protein
MAQTRPARVLVGTTTLAEPRTQLESTQLPVHRRWLQQELGQPRLALLFTVVLGQAVPHPPRRMVPRRL